ncbi:MAG: hypothetical protein PHP00_08200 [Thiotrichaceae bacterium]|nr:hypothetical protein [Thiotrichaceae bacterium]
MAMADPDEPFTASTVSEAIELQKIFLVKEKQGETSAQERRVIRDKALAPLRAALSVTLEKREIMPRAQFVKATHKA